MWDFLSFNRFITQDVLIFFYYIGAVVMPIFLYFSRSAVLRRFTFFKTADETIHGFFATFSFQQKVMFWVLFIIMFFCMELCWRMVFEAMIGYFDMHEYLRALQKSQGF